MTWTRPTAPLGTTPPKDRPWHYAASRSTETTVALCGVSWPTGLSEGKGACTPPARCPACDALRSVAHATPESRAKVATRAAARRAAAVRNRTMATRTAED